MADNKFIWADKDFQYNAITYGFDVRSGMPIDRRLVLTKDQMFALSRPPLSIIMPNNYFCVLRGAAGDKETKLYVYNNDADLVVPSEGDEYPVGIGRFRLYDSGHPVSVAGKPLEVNEDGFYDIPIATVDEFGVIKPDGATVLVDSEGVLKASGFCRIDSLIGEDPRLKNENTIYYLEKDTPEYLEGLYAYYTSEGSSEGYYEPIGGHQPDDVTIKLDDAGKLQAQYQASEGVLLDGVTFKANVDDKTIKVVDGKLVALPEPLVGGKATKVVYGTPVWDSEAVDVLVDSETIDIDEYNRLQVLYDNTTLKVENGLGVLLSPTGGLTDNIAGEMYDGLRIKPAENGGLSLSSEGVAVIADNKGVKVDSEGVGLILDDEGGLEIGANGLKIKTPDDKGLELGSEGLVVVVSDSEGVEIKNGKVAVKVDGDTIVFNSEGELTGAKKLESVLPVYITSEGDAEGEQKIKLLYDNESLTESEGVLKAVVVKPLEIDANGINLQTSEGLEVVGDKLRVNLNSEGLRFENGAVTVNVSDYGMQLRNNELAAKIDKGLKYASEGADIPHAVMANIDDYTVKFDSSDRLYARSVRAGEAIDLTESEGEQVINVCVDGMTVFYNSVGDVIELHIDGDHALEMGSEGLSVKVDNDTIVFTSEGGKLTAVDFHSSELDTFNKYGVDAINELLTFLGHSEWGIDGHTEEDSVRYILNHLREMVGTAGYASFDQNGSEADNPDITNALKNIFTYLGDFTDSEYEVLGLTDVGEFIDYILGKMGDFDRLTSEGLPGSDLVSAILNLLARMNATKPMILDNSASEFGGQVLRLVETSEDFRLSAKLHADSPVKAVAYGTGDYYLGLNSFEHHFNQSSDRTANPLKLNIGNEADADLDKSRSIEYNTTTQFLEAKVKRGLGLVSQTDDTSEGRHDEVGISVNTDNETVKVYGWSPKNDLDTARATGAYANKLYVNHDTSLKVVSLSGDKYLGVSSYSDSFEWDGTTTQTYTSPHFTTGELLVQVIDPDGWVVYPDVRILTYPHTTNSAKVQVRFNAGFNAGVSGFYDILVVNVGHKAPASDNYN